MPFLFYKNNYCIEIQFYCFCLHTGNTGFDKTKYIKMLLHWTSFVIVKLPDIENSFVTEKYRERIIIHGDEGSRQNARTWLVAGGVYGDEYLHIFQ